MATQSIQSPSSETLSQDIRSFVQKQEAEKKQILSENAEVNELVRIRLTLFYTLKEDCQPFPVLQMIKAIQVLRIHLLELEKVQELCNDFCNRYITCLRGKMQSENLLRSDYGGYDSDDSSSGGGGGGGGGMAGMTSASPAPSTASSSASSSMNAAAAATAAVQQFAQGLQPNSVSFS